MIPRTSRIRFGPEERSVWARRFGIAVCAGIAYVLLGCGVRTSGNCTDTATCIDPTLGSKQGASVASGEGTPPPHTADAGVEDAANLDGGDTGSEPPDAVRGTTDDAGSVDGTAEGQSREGDGAADSGRDAATPADSGSDAPGFDDAADSGSLGAGLVAFYPFDEASGTTSADGSGHAHTAIMNGATFAPGLRGNAATLSGSNQYVSLPTGIVSGLTSFSVCEWVKVTTALLHAHVVDFGTGTNAYMFLTPGTNTLQFAITAAGVPMEQRLNANQLSTGRWHHVAITLAGVTGTLYVDGAQVAQNTTMTSSPFDLGNTTQNWLGRSQDPVDPYFDGQIDNFRIYDRALSAAEIAQLFQGQL